MPTNTPGEPAGIGPDLCLLLAAQAQPYPLIAIASQPLLAARASQLQLAVQLIAVEPGHWPEQPAAAGSLYVWDTPLSAPVVAGQLDPANAAYVLETLHRAGSGCINGDFAGMITAPVHKGVINQAGIPFSGHTEYLAELTHTEQVVMMLATHGLRVALVTTHLPLRDVADAITPERLERVTRILHADLVNKFGIAAPRILVCGLNPHAGESGHMGREEIEVVAPVIAALRAERFALSGPLSADTMFHAAARTGYDAAICMYHDQALIPIKTIDFAGGVNLTLGLPFIRTSPDHGTAFDIAGRDMADPSSLIAALRMARTMARRRVQAAGAGR